MFSSGNRWLRDISETILGTRTTKPDGVVLATLLQATRGLLLIVFNMTIFIQFGRMRSIPGVDVMAVLPTPIFFLIGFIDILMSKRLWSKGSKDWEYGIAMSAVICCIFSPVSLAILLTPFSMIYWTLDSAVLVGVIALFAIAELVALVTPDTRNYY